MRKYLFTTLVTPGVLMAILLLSACKEVKQHAPQQEVCDFQFSETVTSDSLVERIDYFSLGHSDGKTLGRPGKISRCGDNIIIADYRYGIIFAYDSETGGQKFVIDSPGQGPGEYAELRSVACDKDNIYVVDNSRAQLLCFSGDNGAYLWSRPMPIVADDMETLDNGGFIFASSLGKNVKTSIPQERARLFVTDGDLNVTATYYPYADGEYDVIGQKYYLTKNQGKILFGSVMIDGFTEINAEDATDHRQFVFDFPNGLAASGCDDAHEVNKYQHLSVPPFVVGDNYMISYVTGAGTMNYNLWNSDSKLFYNNPKTDISKAIMPVIGALDDKFVAYIDDYNMYQGGVKHGFTAASAEIEQHLKNDGAVLVFYTMK